MSLTPKKPKKGDFIEHTCTLNGTFRGTVNQLLGMQFTYITEDTGNERFCLYREVWKYYEQESKTKT
jgi:hypothetical protein